MFNKLTIEEVKNIILANSFGIFAFHYIDGKRVIRVHTLSGTSQVTHEYAKLAEVINVPHEHDDTVFVVIWFKSCGDATAIDSWSVLDL